RSGQARLDLRRQLEVTQSAAGGASLDEDATEEVVGVGEPRRATDHLEQLAYRADRVGTVETDRGQGGTRPDTLRRKGDRLLGRRLGLPPDPRSPKEPHGTERLRVEGKQRRIIRAQRQRLLEQLHALSRRLTLAALEHGPRSQI